MRTSLVPFLAASLLLSVTGCASAPPPPPPAPVDPAPPPEPPLPALTGDDQLPERFQKVFRTWLKDDLAGVYQRVVEVSEASNAVSVVIERRIEIGGECRVGPSTISIIENDDGTHEEYVVHFGDDCCPGTTCAPTPLGYNLRWIRAVASKDWAALATLVPAKGKLTWTLVTAGEDGKIKKSKKAFTRRDVAAGKFDMAPGCGFIHTQPSCSEPDPKTGAFSCRCDGGGTHTELVWKKEGDAMVVTLIDESSS